MPAFGDIGLDLTETMRRFLANLMTGYFFGFLDPDFFVGISVTLYTISYDFLFLLPTNFSLPPKNNCRNHSFQRAGAGFCDDTSMTPSRRHTRPRSCLVFIPAQYRCSSLQTGLDIVFMDDLLLNFARFFCAPG
jgi:hypothetical protein